MLNLYTIVRTPDGRLGIYVSGWSGGDLPTALAQVVYEDLTMVEVPEAELRKANIALNYDCERMRFKRGDQHWQDVLRRWLCNRNIEITKHELELAVERQEHPTCWADMEGLIYALACAFEHRGWDAVNGAWRQLFRCALPDNMYEFLEAYHADAEERYIRYSEQVSGQMTPADLAVWLLKRYFSAWEMKEAHRLLRSRGRQQAVKYLRDQAVTGAPGQWSPYGPGFETGNGRVKVWGPGRRQPREPDLVMTCERLAKIALSPMAVQGILF